MSDLIMTVYVVLLNTISGISLAQVSLYNNPKGWGLILRECHKCGLIGVIARTGSASQLLILKKVVLQMAFMVFVA